MVVSAQGVEFVETRVPGAGPVLAVVDLAAGASATLDGAQRLLEQQRDLLGRGRAAAEVRDVQHVDALGDDQVENGLAEQVAGRVQRESDRAR